MTHGLEQVIERGMCIGCGACAIQSGGAVSVTLGKRGMYEAKLGQATEPVIAAASRVCPFSDHAKNEDELGASRFAGSNHNAELGYFREVWAGRLTDDSRLLGSSSGGMTSWLLGELLTRNEVDGILHVGRAPEGHFEYRVSTEVEDLLDNRKSHYSSVTLEDVLVQVRGDGLRYALVGVPCFVKAARLLAEQDEVLGGQLKYYFGLVCGHLKSQFFAESLAWQAGVPPQNLGTIDFRVKNPDTIASRYDYAVRERGQSTAMVQPVADTLDGNWGYGAFQPNACNYCDDVFAETADVVFADAWLPNYLSEWRGTNVVVSRNDALSGIIEQGASTGALILDAVSPAVAAQSQAGNFRHRRDGLQVRLADDVSRKLSVPLKRVPPTYKGSSFARRALIRQRRLLSHLSQESFAEARTQGDFSLYSQPMMRAIRRYDLINAFQRGLLRPIAGYMWRLVTRLLGKPSK